MEVSVDGVKVTLRKKKKVSCARKRSFLCIYTEKLLRLFNFLTTQLHNRIFLLWTNAFTFLKELINSPKWNELRLPVRSRTLPVSRRFFLRKVRALLLRGMWRWKKKLTFLLFSAKTMAGRWKAGAAVTSHLSNILRIARFPGS